MAAEKTLKFVKDGVVVGGTAALLSVIGEAAMEQTNLGEAAKGAVQAAAGGALAFGLASKAPRIATGALVYGVTALGRGVVREVAAQAYIAAAAPAPAALPAAAGAGTSGSLPAGGSGTQPGSAVRIPQRASYGELYEDIIAVR